MLIVTFTESVVAADLAIVVNVIGLKVCGFWVVELFVSFPIFFTVLIFIFLRLLLIFVSVFLLATLTQGGSADSRSPIFGT
jgi:hypothetical protein